MIICHWSFPQDQTDMDCWDPDSPMFATRSPDLWPLKDITHCLHMPSLRLVPCLRLVLCHTLKHIQRESAELKKGTNALCKAKYLLLNALKH